MSDRDKMAAWVISIAAFVGLLLWLSTQPPTYGAGEVCVKNGHDLVCE